MAPFAIDFYVLPMESAFSGQRLWLVCGGTTSHCLATHEAVGDAIAHAIRIAEYRCQAGKAAQVHLRREEGAHWKTVWHDRGETPRFP